MTTTLSPATVIEQIDYKLDWSFTVTPTPNGPCLLIEQPHGTDRIPLPLVALRYMSPRRVALWVFEQVRDIEIRQAEAAFLYAGQRIGEIEGP